MAKVIQVIETTEPRGSGKDESSPIRGVVQYWSLDGVLLAEVDPHEQANSPKKMWRDKSVMGSVTIWKDRDGRLAEFPSCVDPNHREFGSPGGPWTLA